MDRPDEMERWAQDRLSTLGVRWFGPAPRLDAAVVGVDGSEPSQQAVQWAGRLAPHVHAVAALGRPKTGGPAGVAESSSWDQVALITREEALAALKAAEKALPSAEVETHLVAGQAAAEVLACAADTGAGLICVGHGGKGLVGRALLGSVSEALVHHAPRSVLVARGTPGPGPIVVGLGDDEGTSEAAAWGVSLARWLGRELVLAHASADELAPRALFLDMKGASVRGVGWPPKRGLAELADELGASLVVVGHGSRPGWLGSTAIGTLRHAPCSVLVARPG